MMDRDGQLLIRCELPRLIGETVGMMEPHELAPERAHLTGLGIGKLAQPDKPPGLRRSLWKNAWNRSRLAALSKMSEERSISFGQITHLLLGNFKAFKRTQRIPIRPITLIYGKNNSGKSSIIQALLYAEHVRRTGELTPEAIMKDGKPVLDGGWSRLAHGRGSEPFIKFGWEWSNPQSIVGLESGKILHRVESVHELTFQSELNGEEFMSVSDLSDAWISLPPCTGHPSYRSAVATAQKWMAHEFRLRMEDGYASDDKLSEVFGRLIPLLEEGAFAKEIDAFVFGEPGAALNLAGLGLPPRFCYRSKSEHDLDFGGHWVGGLRIGHFARGFEAMSEHLHEGSGDDMLANWGLGNDLESHVRNFITEHCNHVVCRWFIDAWAHFDGYLASLVGTTHYLSAVRTRPDHVVFRTPRDLTASSKERPQRLALKHQDWIWQEQAVEKANAWLKKKDHQKLTGNIELRIRELSSRKGRGAAAVDNSNAGKPATVVLYDRDRRVSLNFSEAGYGLSQFLPVLLACFAQQDSYSGKPSGTLLIEEPEAHVHPALQAEIGDVFIEAITRKDHPLAHIVCETHSEHLLLRIMRRLREGKLSKDKVAVLYVENHGKESTVCEMPLDDKGRLIRDWPGGFFEEGLREVLT